MATRANILAVARQHFDADIEPSLVMCYFGSKQGLFIAAAEFDLHFPDLATVPREEAGSLLVSHFLEL